MLRRNKSATTADEQSPEQKLEWAAQRDAEGQASKTAGEMSRKLVDEVLKNPQFFDRFTDADADSAVYDWVEAELGPLFSAAHVLGNRGDDYERKAEWLGLNKAERLIAERSPGRTLKKHPDVLRVTQGAAYDPETGETGDPRPPLEQDGRRVIRDAIEVETNRKSLSIRGKGTDALTTATAEHRTVRNHDEEERSSARKAAGKLFR